jgi:hypothetical protein
VGGSGSTRWGNHTPAPLVEEALRLDLFDGEIQSALREPGEAVGTITFSLGGQPLSRWRLYISPATGDGPRKLPVRPADDPYEPAQLFELRQVRVGFHERVYAVCLGCQKTTRILCALPNKGRFACKKCTGVQYQSVRKHDARIDKLARAIRQYDETVLDRCSAAWQKRDTHSAFVRKEGRRHPQVGR